MKKSLLCYLGQELWEKFVVPKILKKRHLLFWSLMPQEAKPETAEPSHWQPEDEANTDYHKTDRMEEVLYLTTMPKPRNNHLEPGLLVSPGLFVTSGNMLPYCLNQFGLRFLLVANHPSIRKERQFYKLGLNWHHVLLKRVEYFWCHQCAQHYYPYFKPIWNPTQVSRNMSFQ